ncbi:HAMP domain-containing sensor histidine kinase [Sulfurimonas sp.]|uniref:sensor histidine kinase n=1 Tax=Sulfurimonas sp. TaxID=2022749 RepID=UPI002621224E|nr:HAMP domain-containing sensor histidine kinase [Sulfurimonas sp.]MDD5156508.1 HAMP domain-containing sensor histidine kinase [Sulfurimonas sp.]
MAQIIENRAEICNDICGEVAFLSRKVLDLNKQIIDSEKAKTRFLSLIANELNNPMTALLGLIPHLAKQSTQPRQDLIDTIEDEALHLDFHIQNLVAATEIESGELEISYSLVNLEDLIKEVSKSLKFRMIEKNIKLKVDNHLKQRVVADAQKLHLILKNLIANACVYGDADTTIEVTIEQKDENKLNISVKNYGKEPNVKHKAQVFTRFAHDLKGIHGLGVGLSVVRELCERFDGKIDYVVGDNTVTFVVVLPLETKSADFEAYGSNEFLFESFDNALEL